MSTELNLDELEAVAADLESLACNPRLLGPDGVGPVTDGNRAVLALIRRVRELEAVLLEVRDSRAPDYADAAHPGWTARADTALRRAVP